MAGGRGSDNRLVEATAATKVFSGALSDKLRQRKALVILGYALAALTKAVFPLERSRLLLLGQARALTLARRVQSLQDASMTASSICERMSRVPIPRPCHSSATAIANSQVCMALSDSA